MDNFRQFRSPKPKGKNTGFVDGIINNQPNIGRHPLNGRTSMPSSGNIGDFSQQDGFHPMQQDVIQSNMLGRQPQRTANGTIALDMPEDLHKKRRFSRKNRIKNPRSKKKKILISISIILLVVLTIAGFLFAKGYIKLHKVFQGGSSGAPALDGNVNPTKLKGEGDGRVNILLLGKGGEGHTGADLTDTLLIASIDPVHKEAALLSIPRDLYVKTPSSGSMKINSVYAIEKSKILN
ncbi:MAG: LCP family protein, partial [Patescibacteria group bacterium]